MKILNKIWVIALMATAIGLQSCDDFFETDPKDIINEEDYIAEEDEMYKGFLGIVNRVQEAGDHAIFLTDTRAAVLETTDNAPDELKAIYNYSETNGNSYADPTCYYSIIIACNDYFNKMGIYHQNVGGMTEIAEANFPKLLSSAVRIKAWAYLMLGKIYGEAYWFDDPLTEKKPLSDGSVFTHCNMKELADHAINLLENGITVDGMHIESNLEVDWYKWLDPENQDIQLYRKWQFIAPPAVVLEAEFRSWRASYVDEAAAQADWQWIHDNILSYIYDIHTIGRAEAEVNYRVENFPHETDPEKDPDLARINTYVYQLIKLLQSDDNGAYSRIFFTEDIGSRYQLISTIMYDYKNHQRNRIVQYFCPEYPDPQSFYLQPSEYGISIYNQNDIRGLTQKWTLNNIAGKNCVSKYYYGYDFATRRYKYLDDKQKFEIQPSIPTFRGHDLHFLLAEAETHLGHFNQAYVLLNHGLDTEFPDKSQPWLTDANWDQRYGSWSGGGSGGYGNIGIAGAANATYHKLPRPADPEFQLYTTDQLKKMYDWALADEHMKEFVAEGKSYSYMCKIADRYSNSSFRGGNGEEARDSVAKRIAPKYVGARKNHVEQRIKGSGYWITWNLQDL